MADRRKDNSKRPHFDLLDAISGRLPFLVIEALHSGPLSINDLCKRLHYISGDTLHKTLRELKSMGIISDLGDECTKEGVMYRLTEIGTSAVKPMLMMYLWSKSHYEDAIVQCDAEASAKRYYQMHRVKDPTTSGAAQP